MSPSTKPPPREIGTSVRVLKISSAKCARVFRIPPRLRPDAVHSAGLRPTKRSQTLLVPIPTNVSLCNDSHFPMSQLHLHICLVYHMLFFYDLPVFAHALMTHFRVRNHYPPFPQCPPDRLCLPTFCFALYSRVHILLYIYPARC